MGLFSRGTKEDALRQINKINVEMRAISASMHLNYNMIDGRNKSEIKSHYNNIVRYTQKYESIKRDLSEIDNLFFQGETVDVWNGERVDVFTWETYLFHVMHKLSEELNY